MTIEETVRTVLGADRIEQVRTSRGTNDDGAETDKILIVYRTGRDPSAEDMAALLDALWARGDDDPDFAIPVPTFRSAADARELAAA